MLNCCYWVLPKVGQSYKVVRVVLFCDCISQNLLWGDIYNPVGVYIPPFFLCFFLSFFKGGIEVLQPQLHHVDLLIQGIELLQCCSVFGGVKASFIHLEDLQGHHQCPPGYQYCHPAIGEPSIFSISDSGILHAPLSIRKPLRRPSLSLLQRVCLVRPVMASTVLRGSIFSLICDLQSADLYYL